MLLINQCNMWLMGLHNSWGLRHLVCQFLLIFRLFDPSWLHACFWEAIHTIFLGGILLVEWSHFTVNCTSFHRVNWHLYNLPCPYTLFRLNSFARYNCMLLKSVSNYCLWRVRFPIKAPVCEHVAYLHFILSR